MKTSFFETRPLQKTKKTVLLICLSLLCLFLVLTFTSAGWAGKNGLEEDDLSSAQKPISSSPVALWIETHYHEVIEIPSSGLTVGSSYPEDEESRAIALIDYFHQVLKGGQLLKESASISSLYVDISTWEELQSTPDSQRRALFNGEGLIWRIPTNLLRKDHPVFTEPLWLENYFSDHLPTLTRGEDVTDLKIILELPHEKYGCWNFDPTLEKGLSWWGLEDPNFQIPLAYRLFQDGLLSLEDQWVPLSWSYWFSKHDIPEEVILLHIDDHQDMMDPRLGQTAHGHLYDFITADRVDFRNPSTVKQAILSGALGKGSILTPLLFITRVHVRHLTARPIYSTPKALVKNLIRDSLLTESRPSRLHLSIEDSPQIDEAQSNYYDTDNPKLWLADLPADVPVLLHVDMDYFNNRYDGNSGIRTYDPPQEAQKVQMDSICDLLQSSQVSKRIVHTSFGVSPGFYPGELWPLTDYFLEKLQEANIGLGARIDPTSL